jgi:hypothetical protein
MGNFFSTECATMKNRAPGIRALAGATLLVLLVRSGEGFSRGNHHPALALSVTADDQSDRLVCTARQTRLPAGSGAIILQILLPPSSTVKSAMLKSASGQLAVDLPPRPWWPVIYETTLDGKKAKCAPSGAFVLVVEGEFETTTVSCPETPLFKAGACE